ncbi:MAG: flavin-nucleotide-binding protein [Gammaproteobacteria bacterium]|nr:MAG: flavin-nucleotide-binding protein [Gammaproteobacteria bacterium]
MKVVRNFFPPQHQDFYHALPYLFLGHADNEGWPWASLVHNQRGFIESPDDQTLNVNAQVIPGDPLQQALNNGSRLGVLGIDLEIRRRNRLTAHCEHSDDQGFVLKVDQTFGNCPKYIQTRHQLPIAPADQKPITTDPLASFDDAAEALISASDTFFVATHYPGDTAQEDTSGDTIGKTIDTTGGSTVSNNISNSTQHLKPTATDPRIGADVSHRGGAPGFVNVVDAQTLIIPDYRGNKHFNTLGNILETSKAGLLFIDFERGDLLTMTGHAEILWDAPDLEDYLGAERLWSFKLHKALRIKNALPFRWVLEDYSPHLPKAKKAQ